MRKRVLLAEESDATRKVAESVLRENGFEVISVSSGDKGLEVIEFSRPDLVVAGSELAAKGRNLFYEQIQQNPRTSSVPLLLFVDAGQGDLPLPSEVLIERPLDPASFIEKVNTFVGRPSEKQSAVAAGAQNPLSDANLEDDFLDMALGLDRIDVTESEVMDKTQITTKKAKSKPSQKTDGYDAADETSDSGKVESLLIREGDAEIRPKGDKTDKSRGLASSGKIEILNDQYGLVDAGAIDLDNEHADHDYQWFINEMQRDNSGFAPTGAGQAASDSEVDPFSDLEFSDNSSTVDPVTPPPKSEKKEKAEASPGVDKFIDEFKKEIEKIRSDEPESVTISEGRQAKSEGPDGMSWEDTLEKMTPEEIGVFTRQFVSEVADRVAQLIVGKIDSDKLLQLLRREIMSRLDKTRKPSN